MRHCLRWTRGLRAHTGPLPDRSARLTDRPTRLSPTTSAGTFTMDSSAAALLQGPPQGGFARTDTTRGHLSTCLSPACHKLSRLIG